MTTGLLLSVNIAFYLVIALSYCFSEHRYGMALAFASYGIANAGLIWDLSR